MLDHMVYCSKANAKQYKSLCNCGTSPLCGGGWVYIDDNVLGLQRLTMQGGEVKGREGIIKSR